MKYRKLNNFLKKVDEGMYKNCFIKIKLDRKGFMIKAIIEKELLLTEVGEEIQKEKESGQC